MIEIDVKRVAMLARIRLTDSEATELGPQLEDILGYVDKLRQIDTQDVSETAHPHDAATPLRADVVSNTNRRNTLLAPAPCVESGLYVVPKVVE